MTMNLRRLRCVTLLCIPWAATATLAYAAAEVKTSPATAPASAAPQLSAAESQEDQRRTEARAYAIGKVRRITFSSPRFFDAEGKPCAANPAPARITERYVRSFLRQAVPISQVAVMNYYGSFGECISDDVSVQFTDGRQMHLSFAADSGVGYLSPVHQGTGKEEDVYFYACEVCKR